MVYYGGDGVDGVHDVVDGVDCEDFVRLCEI